MRQFFPAAWEGKLRRWNARDWDCLALLFEPPCQGVPALQQSPGNPNHCELLSFNPFQGESNWGLNPFLVRQGSCLVVKVQTSDSMSKVLGKASAKSYFLSDRFIQGRITLNEFKTHSSRCQKSDCLLFSLFRTLKNKLMSMRVPHWTMFPIHQQQEISNLWRRKNHL